VSSRTATQLSRDITCLIEADGDKAGPRLDAEVVIEEFLFVKYLCYLQHCRDAQMRDLD
jgi:hypothetical protein